MLSVNHTPCRTKVSQENSHNIQLQTLSGAKHYGCIIFFIDDGWTQVHALYNPQTLENFGSNFGCLELEPGQFRVSFYFNRIIYRHISTKTFLCQSRTLLFRSQHNTWQVCVLFWMHVWAHILTQIHSIHVLAGSILQHGSRSTPPCHVSNMYLAGSFYSQG